MAYPVCPPGPAGTHSVVSWLMLVKDELLKELILLLLRSLEKARASAFGRKEGLCPWMTFRASPLPHPPLALRQQGGQGSLSGEDVGAQRICH